MLSCACFRQVIEQISCTAAHNFSVLKRAIDDKKTRLPVVFLRVKLSKRQQLINTFSVIANIVENRSGVGAYFHHIRTLKVTFSLTDLEDNDPSMREQLVQLLQIGEVVQLNVLVFKIKQDVSWFADVCVTCDQRILQNLSNWVFVKVERDLLVGVGLLLEVVLQEDQVFEPTAIGCCNFRRI